MFEASPFFRLAGALVLIAGCSYDFGGPTGEGGSGASSSTTGVTGPSGGPTGGPTGSGSTTGATATTDAASGVTATTNGPDQSSGSPAASTSTGVAPVPLARCGDFGDEFDSDNPGVWFRYGAEIDNGFLEITPAQAGPFSLGGDLTLGAFPIAECTLSVTDLFFDNQHPRTGVAISDVDFQNFSTIRWLALMWDGTTVTSEVREGFAVTPGPSLATSNVTRLTIHFTGSWARLYADTTLVGAIDAQGWGGSHRLFAGAIDSGTSRIGRFNPVVNSNEVPPP